MMKSGDRFRRVVKSLFLISLLATASIVNFHVTYAGVFQEKSSQDPLKEAARLCMEAGRLQGEAFKNVKPGGDRKPIIDAYKSSITNFEQAVKLWHDAGDYIHEAR